MIFKPNGTPCYIGKGFGKRMHYHSKLGDNHHNPYLANIFKKYGNDLPTVIIKSGMLEKDAFGLECLLISIIGRKDLNQGPLANRTEGGEGTSGVRHSEATIARLKIIHKGKIQSEESNAKRSVALKGKSTTWLTGQKHSEETKAKRMASLKGRTFSEEARKRISAAKKGKVFTAEHREKLSVAAKRRWHS